MIDVRELIRAKLTEAGLSMKEASEGMGYNHAYLQQFFKRNVPAELPEDARERLAPLLGLQPDQLKPGAPVKAGPYRVPLMKLPPPATSDRIPVMGIAEGGEEGWSLWNGDIVDYAPTPASLAGAPNGYATYVVGTSMEPRYHPGEMLYIHPGKPVAAGSYVLVQVKPRRDGEPPGALVKRLVKKTGTKIVLEQFNPERTFDIPLDRVVSIHKIVGSGD